MKKELEQLLMGQPEYLIDGKLNKNRLSELARKYDAKLLSLLMSNSLVKEQFFVTIVVNSEQTYVFQLEKFLQFLNNKEFLPDSFTAYKTKIGLATPDGRYLSENHDVVLNFPYKDCVLEGGQTKDDAKRQEVFFNETLAPTEINRLLDKKVLTNFKRYDSDGEHEVDELKDTDNLIIKGNNLIALHSLKKRFAGKVKLIYLDPPYYFDKAKGADTFSYNSDFKLSTWLTFMKNRLEIASNLLADGGVILVSMAEDGQAYLKILMDNIFEKNDFVETFIWRNTDNADSLGKKSRGGIEYIHAYEKKKNSSVRWIGKDADNGDAPLLNSSNSLGTLSFQSGTIRFNIPDGLYEAGEKPSLTLEDDLIIENGVNKNTVRMTGKFKWSQDYLDAEIAKGSDFIIKSKRFSIRYQKAEAGNVAPEKFIDERYLSKIFGVGTNEDANNHLKELNLDFSYSKPESLIAFFLRAVTKENDLILDFFLGSGTTAAVAHKMNRQYIGIEQMDYINEVSVPRLQKVIAGEQGGISKDVNWQGGGSFVYTELMPKNMGYLQDIIHAKTLDDLKVVYNRMLEGTDTMEPADISFRADLSKIDWLQGFDENKRLLVKLLDKNGLYYNYSEIDDKNVRDLISDEDYTFNKNFYEGGD